MTYLLDTDVCIFLLRDKFGVREKMKSVGLSNCAVSIITIFELTFGAEKSDNPQKHHKQTETIRDNFQIIPLDYDIANTFAQEKVRLHKAGTPIDNFDLLIGSTALTKDLVMVTGNQKHFSKIQNIKIDNWIAGKR